MSRQRKILIVEDDFIQSFVIERQLESFNYDVVGIANSGEEAIALAKKYKPDVVIMDISLKGQLDGIETAKKILESVDTSIIYITGHIREFYRDRIKHTNYLDIIEKPFNRTKLAAVINGEIKTEGSNLSSGSPVEN
jgi:DNA-binding response OmpR family regulator